MKKSSLFMACCIGLMLLASCKKDPVAPTISILNGSGYVTENTQLYSGEEITVGFTSTGEKLTKIEVSLMESGTVIASHSESIENQPNYIYSHAFNNIDAIGAITITGTVTDANGLTASKSFSITINEKPNKKFVGHYEGDILITGSYEASFTNMDPIVGDLDNTPLPAVVDITAGDDMNEISAAITINGQSNSVKGTVEGNKVIFEAINDTFTYNYQYQSFTIPIPLTMTYSINGLLNGEQLDLDGDCDGNGEINLAFFNINGTFAMDGTIGGSLNKLR